MVIWYDWYWYPFMKSCIVYVNHIYILDHVLHIKMNYHLVAFYHLCCNVALKECKSMVHTMDFGHSLLANSPLQNIYPWWSTLSTRIWPSSSLGRWYTILWYTEHDAILWRGRNRYRVIFVIAMLETANNLYKFAESINLTVFYSA